MFRTVLDSKTKENAKTAEAALQKYGHQDRKGLSSEVKKEELHVKEIKPVPASFEQLLTDAKKSNFSQSLVDFVNYLSAAKRKGNPDFELLKGELFLRKNIINYLLSKSEDRIRGYLEKEDSLLVAWLKYPNNAFGSSVRKIFGTGATCDYGKLAARAGLHLSHIKLPSQNI